MIITKFWQKIWKQHARRITMFQWLLIHRSLPVGAWQRGILSSPNGVACPHATESIQHALYHVPHIIITKIWQKIWKQHTRQIITFQWLSIHRSVPVGAWQRGILSSPNCVACLKATKSIQHALWDCVEIHHIYDGGCCLLQLC